MYIQQPTIITCLLLDANGTCVSCLLSDTPSMSDKVLGNTWHTKDTWRSSIQYVRTYRFIEREEGERRERTRRKKREEGIKAERGRVVVVADLGQLTETLQCWGGS